MKSTIKLWIVFLFVISCAEINSQTVAPDVIPPGGARLMFQTNGSDTIYLAHLRDLWVYPRFVFKTKKQEKFFWRTVQDVKKTLPYAKLLAGELSIVNQKLADISADQERKKLISVYEKEIFKKHEKTLKKMTINQGKMLIKLIDRECERSSYDLIKSYKGNASAFFWQGIARVFGSNLKSEFNAAGEDKIVDRVIRLVEAGQL
ncbi:MAG TPA: DUF4294 domain-containing protein [Paludibacter sp.]|nr:DUF4294 domain-containing protein [Paludibacter sp.]